MTMRRVVAAILLCLLTLVMAGCVTSSAEWSGEMPNETGTHVQPYDVNKEGTTTTSVNPFGVIMLSGRLSATAMQSELHLAKRAGL